jgi:hypothetical protein
MLEGTRDGLRRPSPRQGGRAPGRARPGAGAFVNGLLGRLEGWTRTCRACGSGDGDLVERVAFHPTFRCLVCGYLWVGSNAKLVFLTRPPDVEDGEQVDALVNLLVGQ